MTRSPAPADFPTPPSPGVRARLADERGIALLVTLMLSMLLVGLGSALVFMSMSETAIATNYRAGHEVLYGADAASERVVQDLLLVPDWNAVLAGTARSGFTDDATTVTLSDNTQIDLVAQTTALQAATNTLDVWGPNDPIWRLYAYGPLDRLLPGGAGGNTYVALWVGDDPSESDADPTKDTNGVLTLHAEAYGPFGARRVIEVTVARTSSTEIERGYVAQRGQEELNQRSRKAAVQTPGAGLSATTMKADTGQLQ
jgi:hypothetical protein